MKTISDIKLIDTKSHRKDMELRTAIENIQAHYFNETEFDNIHKSALTQLELITKSDLSVCLIFKHESTKQLHDVSLVETHSSPSYSCALYFELVNAWLDAEQHALKPKLFDKNIPRRYMTIFAKVEEEVASLMFLPICINGSLNACYILTRRSTNFHHQLPARLSPFLGSLVSVVQNATEPEPRIKGISKIIKGDYYLKALMQNSLCGLLVVHNDIVLFHNAAAVDMLNNDMANNNAKKSNFEQCKITDFFAHYAYAKEQKKVKAASLESPQQFHNWQITQLTRTDGSHIDVKYSVFHYSHRNQDYTTICIDYINEPSDKIDAINQQDDSFSIASSLPVAIVQVTLDWKCKYTNPKWQDFSNLTMSESLDFGWLKAIHAEDLKRLLEDLAVCVRHGAEFRREIRIVSIFNKIKWVDFHANPITDNEKKITGFVGVFSDISEQKQFAERLKDLSKTDALTGLFNRAALSLELENTIEAYKFSKNPITVLFIDLDKFKLINDTYGHSGGDEVIIQSANRLKGLVSDYGVCSRFGGDEFVVLLNNLCDISTTKQLVNEILIKLSEPIQFKSTTINVQASIGAYSSHSHHPFSQDFFSFADHALYVAKGSGRNQIRFFDKQLLLKQKKQEKLVKALKDGVTKQNFILHFQPIVCANTLCLSGIEVLLRFKENEKQILYPGTFLSTLEETKLIIDVGKWMIRESMKTLRRMLDSEVFPTDAYFSLNVSAVQLNDPYFFDDVVSACVTFSIPPKMITLEITESTLIKQRDTVRTLLEKLRTLGFKIALDDFGTGYSSLTYLQNFNFDIIKIDKSFVSNVENNEYNYNIIGTIVTLAKQLKSKTTAEGIEDFSQMDLLKELQVDNIQGFLVEKPLDETNLINFLKTKLYRLFEHPARGISTLGKTES